MKTPTPTSSEEKLTFIQFLKTVIATDDLRRIFPILALASLLANLLALALPLGMLQIFDRVLKNQAIDTLAFLALGIICLMLLEEVLKGINVTLTNWLSTRFKHKTSLQLLDKFFKVPTKVYNQEEPGAYGEKMQAASKAADVYSGSALLALLDLPFAFIFLGVIWLIAGVLVLVPLVLLVLFAFASLAFGRWMYSQVVMRDINDERRISFLTEVLAGIISIKTMSLESIMLRRYERLKENSAAQGERLFFGNSFAGNLGGVMSQIMIVLIIFFGALLVLNDAMSSGALAACMMLSVRALQPLQKGLSVWMRYQVFIAGDKQLKKVLALPNEQDISLGDLTEISRSLRLENITISRSSHEGEQFLFNNLNLTINKGECVAFRGDSGTGKTWLFHLLNGIEQPNAGRVLIDDLPLLSFNLESVRQKIAFLPQEGVVFVGTILENLTMFNPEREALALEISKQIGLDLIVAKMKQGYQTPLGENASETLSMGIRQQISIVRALAFNPAVILFDEANSALDFEGDRLLREYLTARKGELTIAMVTNRPSMLRLADTIYRLNNGQLEDDDGAFNFANASDDQGIDRPEPLEALDTIIKTRVFNHSDLSHCLLPLLHTLGWSGSSREFSQALPHLADHVDISYFFGAMVNLGYKARYFNNSFKGFDNRLLPCVFISEKEPALAVLATTEEGGYKVFNSATQQEEVLASLPKGSGEVYVFQPLEEAANNKTTFVKEFFWKFRKHISLVFIITLISTLLAIAPSLFVRSVFDKVIPSEDMSMAVFLLLGALLAILVSWLLNLLRGRLMAYIGGRIEYVLGNAIFERIIKLPLTSLSGTSVSQQIGRIKSLERFRDLFLGPLATLIFDLPASVILLITIYLINPYAAGIILLAIVAFSALIFISRASIKRAADNTSEAAGKKNELIDESLGKMNSLRTLGSRTTWMKRFRNLSGKAVYEENTESNVQKKVATASQLISSFTGLAVLVTTALMVIHGKITGGTIMATMILTWRLISPLQNLFTALTGWSRIQKNIMQVNQLMRLPQESDGHNPEASRFVNKGAIEFSRVSFRYAADLDPALLGISFKVPVKKLVGITGPDGAGKSTLLALISRLHYAQAGSIRIDTIDTRQISADYLRTLISYMPQKCDVFYGTIAQNLRLVHPSATDEELHWAIEMAGLKDDIDRMDEGINTRIYSSKVELMSSGFKQRLSLARTILKPASIVLLDEPGNGMDNAGEEALMRCINWLHGRVTLILVTPRPSHLRMADHILYMENNTITARGTYAEVESKIMAGLN